MKTRKLRVEIEVLMRHREMRQVLIEVDASQDDADLAETVCDQLRDVSSEFTSQLFGHPPSKGVVEGVEWLSIHMRDCESDAEPVVRLVPGS
jgi:hypothetical protein